MSDTIFDKAEKKANSQKEFNTDLFVKSIDNKFLRDEDIFLPSFSESEVVRHFTNLSKKNFALDSGFYPLGSCTMKYNPKINEWASMLDGFANIHPNQPDETLQGALALMYVLQKQLCAITGMDAVSLQPKAGAHGELTGMMVIKAYFENKGIKKTKVIVPDSAHGTNPASAKMCGFDVIEVKSTPDGLVDINELEKLLDDEVAALMLTNPNTLGLFEKNISKISNMVHDKGGLLYYDGANFNAVMGISNPAIMGFDVVHLNLHKTFSTPHGCGGPGAGPIGVVSKLEDFLPSPVIRFDGKKYYRDYDIQYSIGKVSSFFGNFSVLVKAFTYITMMGKDLKQASIDAVLNANYIRAKLQDCYQIAIDEICGHEFVLTNEYQKAYGVNTLQLAKRLIDYGFHPPTIYFPLIVHEAMMIEPTESETKETLDYFIEIMKKIDEEAKENPQLLADAPHNTPVRKVDETNAARHPNLKWSKPE
ncbi:MAG: aminomethyl-transferring glycine dehydrogenase subunit GcvPB [Candidatus Gastranaerophilales bacterium]|nr:aminomethyl-transferring glycine dehydrogenase subunit GcvPB [Candidatus Gastranaerophilales bacterium]